MPGEFKVWINPSPKALARILKHLGDEFKDWRPAWRTILPVLLAETGKNIRSQGANIGKKWAPLAQSTIRRKARAGKGRAPLVYLGSLLAMMSGPKGVRSMTRGRLKLGTKKKEHFVQQFGNPSHGMPARRFIGWSRAGRAKTRSAMQAHAAALIQQASAQMDSV